jgi:hypothetical protein
MPPTPPTATPPLPPDPYAVLGIPPEADDQAIRAAFHARVRAGTADAQVNAAYGAVRDAQARRRRRWCDPTALIAPLPVPHSGIVVGEALIAELAMLSDWELGDAHA